MKIRLLLTLVGLAVGFAMPTFAQEQRAVDPEVHRDKRGEQGEDEGGVHKEIADLEAKVVSLQGSVSALQNEIKSLKTSNTMLNGQVTTLQTQLTAVQANHALALGPFVSVDPNPEIGVIGPNITFTGANIHIVSGSGRTDDNGTPRGLGNLIIGYDDDPQNLSAGQGGGTPLQSGDRRGSHNLVIGGGNRFTQSAFGGLVAGELNTISSLGATVSGGRLNTASAQDTSVNGGIFNTASGGECAVNGGISNIANGSAASVSGGYVNTAGGLATVVIGGQGVEDNTWFSIAPRPPFP